jgi:hypothetical protein
MTRETVSSTEDIVRSGCKIVACTIGCSFNVVMSNRVRRMILRSVDEEDSLLSALLGLPTIISRRHPRSFFFSSDATSHCQNSALCTACNDASRGLQLDLLSCTALGSSLCWHKLHRPIRDPSCTTWSAVRWLVRRAVDRRLLAKILVRSGVDRFSGHHCTKMHLCHAKGPPDSF